VHPVRHKDSRRFIKLITHKFLGILPGKLLRHILPRSRPTDLASTIPKLFIVPKMERILYLASYRNFFHLFNAESPEKWRLSCVLILKNFIKIQEMLSFLYTEIKNNKKACYFEYGE
jgi:hypothetical protein